MIKAFLKYSFLKNIAFYSTTVVMYILLLFYKAFVGLQLINWFVVPHFHFVDWSWAVVLGFLFVYNALRSRELNTTKDNLPTVIVVKSTYSILTNTLMLGLGWALKNFIAWL